MTAPTKSWKHLVMGVVDTMPRDFELRDVLDYRGAFQAVYPENKHVEAKIRQSLQVLRDQGVIQFLGHGRYRRLDVAPEFSPLIQTSLGEAFRSRSQMARVIIETWVDMNLYCVNCHADALHRLPANAPIADFSCESCTAKYQVKAKDGRFGEALVGAAYQPTLDACREGQMPEYVLIEFDSRFETVVFIDAVHGAVITEDRIKARKPLGKSAKRAGWQGCTIHLGGAPRVRIVAPAGNDRRGVREQWSSLKASISE
jgi:hypothetical protein